MSITVRAAALCAGPVLCLALGAAANAAPARTLYESGTWAPAVSAWIGDGTSSKRTPDGLVVRDGSAEPGSGRFYSLDWGAVPARGAALEARVKAVACSESWGACMLVADGVHEEGVTLFPDRLFLVHAQASIPFDAAGDFHTYRVEIAGQDLRLLADGKLLFDGAGTFTTPAQGTPPRNQCGFGSGSSPALGEAVWQWVRYEADTPAAAGGSLPPAAPVPGLTVTLGETVQIVSTGDFVSLFEFRDGSLCVGRMLSADGGRTWAPGGPDVGVGCFEFNDGEIISPGFASEKIAEGVFELPLSRSVDHGKTFREEKVRLSIPEGTGGTGDDGKHYPGPLADHAVVQCRDGALLLVMYGHFKTDTVLCPAFPPEWKLYKYRTWVMRSTDRGKTWDYLATVAYDPQVGCESFCEGDLLTLPSGAILCFMRTGGIPPQYITPLYLSESADDGKTWSPPRAIADRGVLPNACRMQSGVLAVTYGRPDNWVAFSLDEGKTWVGHTCIYQGPTSSYNCVEEVAPGKLLVLYDRQGLDADGNSSSGAVGQFITVTRP
jgi:hypothetical protein